MIKFLVGFAAAQDLSRAESLSHYRDRHAPLVSSIADFWNHVAGYVQNFALDIPSDLPKRPIPPLDGLSELWFRDWNTFDTAFSEPEYLKKIRPDEERFADFASLIVAFAREVRIFGIPGTPPYKLIRFLRRREGVPADRFREYWETQSTRSAANDPTLRRFCSGYVQNRPLWRADLAFQPTASIDGVDEFWFESVADAGRFLTTIEGEACEKADAVSSIVAQICTETRVVSAPPDRADVPSPSLDAHS